MPCVDCGRPAIYPVNGKCALCHLKTLPYVRQIPGGSGWWTPTMQMFDMGLKMETKTDAQMDEEVRDEVRGWDREKQLAVYKWLNLDLGIRMGAGLDFELSELRRKRRATPPSNP